MRAHPIGIVAVTVLLGLQTAGTVAVAEPAPLDELLQKYDATAQPEASVRIDAWVERGDDATELVLVLQPEGQTKLVADPGITVTPIGPASVHWLMPLPVRHSDPTIDYFTPPATLRLPFTASDQEPIEVLVEYAYCLVNFQCFFGEETLTVAQRQP